MKRFKLNLITDGKPEAVEANRRRRERDEKGFENDESGGDHRSFLGLYWIHSPHDSQEGKIQTFLLK